MNEPTSIAARGHSLARAHEYETVYILRADVDAETAERIQGRVTEALEREQGKLVKAESWGRRKLAYPLGRQRRGVYIYVKYVGGGGLVAEVERNLGLQEAVLKFMTVQTSDAVDLAALQIDPEETKLGKLEPPAEDEKEESREKQLGLVDLGPEAPRSMRRMDEAEEFADDSDEARGGPKPEGSPKADKEGEEVK
ncbi:MAG: 30S ribosomal protein S6 [Polyangiaceae bacterium]